MKRGHGYWIHAAVRARPWRLWLRSPEGVATYGIELDHGRATLARPRLNEVLWCDALQETRYTLHAFGFLFLNPPYDTAITPDEKAQRFETLFLRSFIKALQPNGFLVFIIP